MFSSTHSLTTAYAETISHQWQDCMIMSRRMTNVCRWSPSREFRRVPGHGGLHSGWWPVCTRTDQTHQQTHCTAATFTTHSTMAMSRSKFTVNTLLFPQRNHTCMTRWGCNPSPKCQRLLEVKHSCVGSEYQTWKFRRETWVPVWRTSMSWHSAEWIRAWPEMSNVTSTVSIDLHSYHLKYAVRN